MTMVLVTTEDDEEDDGKKVFLTQYARIAVSTWIFEQFVLVLWAFDLAISALKFI
jgi:hypothetical protein